MTQLRYGNTNTFFIPGAKGGLLLDTDYAGTLGAFYRALKQNGIKPQEINYVLATHFHPDHMGLIGDLLRQGAKLLLADVQKDFVHFSDGIFAKDRLPFKPINETEAVTVSCAESRAFLSRMGICGEIVPTPSHSADSVSLIPDNGDCFVEDLEPREYIPAYGETSGLAEDWNRLLALCPKRVFFGHAPEQRITP